jgi:hypothetical protein
MLSLFALPS